MKFLLLTISLLLGTLSHSCVHDKLNLSLKKIPGPAKHLSFGEKQVTQLSYESIRVHPDYSELTEGTEEIREYIKNQLMPSVISYFSATLKVRRLQERLKFDFRCGDMHPPTYLATQGVDADLVILVTGARYNLPFLTRAVACGINEYDQRPVYGAISFNLIFLSFSSISKLEENLSTTLHEMTHILGFANYLYEYYINPVTGNHCLITSITYIDLEPLTRRVRQHFGCSTIEGAYLENAERGETAGSHFERRVFMNEFMTDGTVTDPIISEFTLALLEGSGWYQVDYSKTEPFLWGENEGCSFLDGPCLDENSQPKFDGFCSPLESVGCSFTARSVAGCFVDSSADNCPYYFGFYFGDCENPNSQSRTNLNAEKFGPTSRCFGGTLGSQSPSGSHQGFCFPTICNVQGDSYVVKVTVGNAIIDCVHEEMITVPGLLGYLECPDPNEFCAKANPIYCEKGCLGRGTCVNRECQCPDGWEGSDCGLRVYKDGCQRCGENSENTACYGDECCNPITEKCPRQISTEVDEETDEDYTDIFGQDSTYTSDPDPEPDPAPMPMPTPDQNKHDGKVGTLICIIVCVIILVWRNKLTRDN